MKNIVDLSFRPTHRDLIQRIVSASPGAFGSDISQIKEDAFLEAAEALDEVLELPPSVRQDVLNAILSQLAGADGLIPKQILDLMSGSILSDQVVKLPDDNVVRVCFDLLCIPVIGFSEEELLRLDSTRLAKMFRASGFAIQDSNVRVLGFADLQTTLGLYENPWLLEPWCEASIRNDLIPAELDVSPLGAWARVIPPSLKAEKAPISQNRPEAGLPVPSFILIGIVGGKHYESLNQMEAEMESGEDPLENGPCPVCTDTAIPLDGMEDFLGSLKEVGDAEDIQCLPIWQAWGDKVKEWAGSREDHPLQLSFSPCHLGEALASGLGDWLASLIAYFTLGFDDESPQLKWCKLEGSEAVKDGNSLVELEAQGSKGVLQLNLPMTALMFTKWIGEALDGTLVLDWDALHPPPLPRPTLQ